MSTMTVDPATPAHTIDVSATPRIPLTRLVRVELRKMANTRSGKWLLIGIGVITLKLPHEHFARIAYHALSILRT